MAATEQRIGSSGPERHRLRKANAVSIVTEWERAVVGDGRILVAAIDDMNKVLNTRYTLSRLAEWRNGTRGMRADVYEYMLRYALGYVMKEFDLRLSPAQMERLSKSISLPQYRGRR